MNKKGYKMKCDFCKRDEIEIKKIFAPIFTRFKEKIRNLEISIQNKKQKYPQEHGFIKENFDKVDEINEVILKMKINTILSDIDNFIKLDPNIELLCIYFKNYNPEISKEKTLKDLVILYKNEPTEIRLNDAVLSLFTEKNDLTSKYNEIKSKYDTRIFF
jgi:hypothetical protein